MNNVLVVLGAAGGQEKLCQQKNTVCNLMLRNYAGCGLDHRKLSMAPEEKGKWPAFNLLVFTRLARRASHPSSPYDHHVVGRWCDVEDCGAGYSIERFGKELYGPRPGQHPCQGPRARSAFFPNSCESFSLQPLISRGAEFSAGKVMVMMC